jgi:hypothetical protein
MCHIVKRLSLFGSSFTLLFLATIAEAQQYQFTKIGDHVYSGFGAPSINDHGLVAYETQRLIDGKNYYVVEAGDGHSLKTIAAASPFTGYINRIFSIIGGRGHVQEAPRSNSRARSVIREANEGRA